MAPNADEPPRGIWRTLPALLAPSPERIEFAVRLALICALTALVVEIYQTPSPALTVYLAFFVNRPDRTTSLITCVVMTLVFTVAVGLVILLAKAVLDVPGWRVATMATISFLFLFLGSASKLRPLASPVALIVAYALDVLGNAPQGEFATRAMLYTWLFVGIPAGVSLVVSLLLAPAPRRLAEQALAQRLRAAAAMVRGNASARDAQAFARALRAGTAEPLGRIRLAAMEKTSPARDIQALMQAARSTMALLFLVDAIARDGTAPDVWRRGVGAVLEEMASAFDAGGYPIDITVPDTADATPGSPLAATLMADLEAALATFAAPPETPPAPAPKPPGGFFLPDAFTNPAHVRYALKTTAAAMICYIVYSLLDWPGIHTCLITCYIVSLGTTAETVEKLGLRILGCMVGAAVGIATLVFVMPLLESIGTLMMIVFAGGLAGAWVAAGSPRIAYAGFQIAFAFFQCVIQGAGPAFDLTVARDRVIGILFGNLVIFVISISLWPVSVSRRIDPAIAALLRRLGTTARAADPTARRDLVPATQAAIGAVQADLDLARYEPAALRPTPAWLQHRQQAVTAIAAMEGPILLSGQDSPNFLATTAHRLDVLADRLAQPSGPPASAVDEAPPVHPASPRQRLHGIVNEQLDVLEQALAR